MSKRWTSLFVAVMLCVSFVLTLGVSAAPSTSYSKEDDYRDAYTGIVDSANTATLKDSTRWFFFYDTTTVTPNPSGAPDRAVAINHSGLDSSFNVSLGALKYVSIYCKYDGSKTLEKPVLTLIGNNGKSITEDITVTANQSIPKGSYGWVDFEVGSDLYGKVIGEAVTQLYIMPYGNMRSGDLTSSDVISIQKIKFRSYDKFSEVSGTSYPIRFTGGRQDVTGNDPETVYVTAGGTITLPENPYSRENYTFNGWLCSADNQVYNPGATYTVKERTRAGSDFLRSATGEAVFSPDWKIINSTVEYPDDYSVYYGDYHNGYLGNKNYFTETKNVIFEGKNTIKFEINTSSSDALLLDGWVWDTMPFDLDKYSYATVTYYFDTKLKLSGTPYIHAQILGNSITGQATSYSDMALQTGKWAVMGFDLTPIKNKRNPNSETHYLKQFHFYLTGHENTDSNRIKASDFNAGDAIYIHTLTLHTKKPADLQNPPGSYNFDYDATTKYIKELDVYEASRIGEIRNTASQYKSTGTVYYVSSSSGSTTAAGTSSGSPRLVTTLSEVSNLGVKIGDTVLFKRGDVFRGTLSTVAGVTYSAYGEGAKPKLYRSEKNHSGSGNWELFYEDAETGKKIWKTAYNVTNDVGAIVLNEGEAIGLKEIPSYVDGKYYVRGKESQTLFDITTELDNDLEFFHDLNGAINGDGIVYFRCDYGNPGKLYYSIEMNQRGNLVSALSNVTIDNLCLMYFGSHGIGAGTVSNLTVTNCEIGYGGGSIQYYYEDTGKVVRFGNGVEIYGGLVNFTIDNNYVYEIYDAGITHQISSTSAGNFYMKNVVYTNNVLCNSTYNIEYFMSVDNASATSERFMEDVLFENNLIRRAGYGWGQQRTDDAPAGIKGWSHHNYAINTVIRNNIIDRCYNHVGGKSHLIQLGTKYNGSTAYLDGNTFVQVAGRDFALSHTNDYKYNFGVESYIGFIGGKNNKVYFAAEDYGKMEKLPEPVDGTNYSEIHKGIADRVATATVTTSETDSAVVITPNPTGKPESPVIMDHYGLDSLNIDLAKLKYISIYCKYDGTRVLDNPLVTVMGHGGKYLTENVTVSSNEIIPRGSYGWVHFDVGSATYGKVTENKLYQFHLKPYGELTSGNLKATDVMNILKIKFTYYDKATEAGIVGVYPLRFTAGREDVTGKDPETVYMRVGSGYTLPQNPYTRENYTFNGWLCSADNQVYKPGAVYTVKERTRVGSSLLYSTTGEVLFYPDWKIVNGNADLPDIFTVDYTDYYNGMLGNKDYFKATYNYDFMGRRTVQLKINPSSSEALLLDGWSWDNMPLNLDEYSYATITYYLDTDAEVSGTPYINFLANGGENNPAPITTTVSVTSDRAIERNKWAIMGFDLSAVKAKLNSEITRHNIKQFHLYFTGHATSSANGVKASDFAEGDAIYMDSLTLYSEKPENLEIVPGIVSGDGNGKVRPHDALTRAEAAQLILNTLGRERADEILAKIPNYDSYETNFTDVAPTDWYYFAVVALDTLGYLPEDGLFRPDDPMTVSEFMRIMFFIEKDNMNGVSSFTADSGSTKPITRAQAVMLLSDWISDGIPTKLLNARVKMFDDLDCDSPEYYAFMNIGATRISSFDEDGNETIYQLLCAGSSGESVAYDTSEGDNYIKELNKYEAKRIEEIRSTESAYTTKSYGKVYYLSSSEGTTNGGSSPENPKLITRLYEVTNMDLKNGDVVLFKRGDVFRGQMTAKAGVTYSAYGEGEKPRLYRSDKNHTGAENWELYYEDEETGKKIWKTPYNVSDDVGGIVLDEGKAFGLKEIPSYVSGKYYVRGQESIKEFDLVTELDRDLEYFQDIGGKVDAQAPVYLRCDAGNPGELYYSIEMNQRNNLIRAASNVTIDNLCLMYFGSHGIGTGTCSNLTVTNCEIGYGGGAIQHYNANGTVTRYGNGVEIYGGLVNFTIDNCYVYEIYDAGITHQISKTSHGNYYMKNVVYTNNVLCDSTYNIEYFMSNDENSETSERFMEDVLFEGNLIRRAGYGWGQQRPDNAPAGIKGWSHNNYGANTTLRNNIIDRCYNYTGKESNLIQLGTKYNGSTAYLDGNTFVQVPGRYFALSHRTTYKYNQSVEDYIRFIGGSGNKVYYASEDYGRK